MNRRLNTNFSREYTGVTQKGDKVLLPQSALQELYPLMTRDKNPLVFCVTNGPKNTYCGVLQFVSEEGTCMIPSWMFQLLRCHEGEMVSVALVYDLKPVAGKTHTITLRPHLTKFIDLHNPKAILEYQLRSFTCLHEGDTIAIPFQNESYNIDIRSIIPKNEYGAICIIGADVNVEFQAPLDFVEPEPIVKPVEDKKKPFSGRGVRIDEKTGSRKNSEVITLPEVEYDPRKHRIHRGVRKGSADYSKGGIQINKPVGTRR